MARSETVKSILKVNKAFYKEHGFYPTFAWIGLRVDKSRERVRQVFSNYREERVKRYTEKSFDTMHFSGDLQLHPAMMLEIKIIEESNGISFREALKSWSYNRFKETI